MLTLVTAWYKFKAKFDIEVYRQWMSNLLTNVKNFKLIVFTNEESKWIIEPFLNKNKNENIKMILLEVEDFNGYKFKDQWIKNHETNHLLNGKVDWRVNMLWSEKIYFVKRAIDNNYFNDDKKQYNNAKENWFGWCDIGYFRGGINNMNVSQIKQWPNEQKMDLLDRNKIYYTQVANSDSLNSLAIIILTKNQNGLPVNPIPQGQVSIAGGFFLITPEKINWWKEVYYRRLKDYFENNYLVKDDQSIIIDCIVNNISHYKLIQEHSPGMDAWFAFSHYLLNFE
jgi:hypothetical protein